MQLAYAPDFSLFFIFPWLFLVRNQMNYQENNVINPGTLLTTKETYDKLAPPGFLLVFARYGLPVFVFWLGFAWASAKCCGFSCFDV